MAKRYKEKSRKNLKINKKRLTKRQDEQENRKIKFKNIVFLIVIIIIIIVVVIGIKLNWFDNHGSKEIGNIAEAESETVKEIVEKIEENKKIKSNLLNPEELNKEIDEIINENGQSNSSYITQIHYKLKDLNNGKIDVYYKANGNELVKMVINIKSKEIESTEKYEDEYLLSKPKIRNNLQENIEEDFNKKKKESNAQDKIVNIIITNTEIVINTNVDNS